MYCEFLFASFFHPALRDPSHISSERHGYRAMVRVAERLAISLLKLTSSLT